MNATPYRVVIVLDRAFGEKLEILPKGVPVWIVDSPLNRTAVERAWIDFPEPNHLKGITIFSSAGNATPEEMLIGQLDAIDLHHGIYSADPPYSVLEVIGVAISDEIRSALEQNGFKGIHPMESGFQTVRSSDAEMQ